MSNSKISALTSATTPLAGTEVLPVVQSSTTKQVSVGNLTAGRAVSALSLATTGGYKNTSSGSNSVSATDGILFTDGAFKNVGLQMDATGGMAGWVYEAGGAGWIKFFTTSISANITFNTGNLVQGTAAKGVNFTANTPASGMTSQLLNWYEEGTWTPVVSDGTNTVSMGTNVGWYVKVGKIITVGWNSYFLNISTLSTTAQLLITGLPFSAGSQDSWCAAIFPYNNVGLNYTKRIPASSSIVYFFVSAASSTDYSNLTKTTLGLPSSVSFFDTMTYRTA
jgi:hypothetical protein